MNNKKKGKLHKNTRVIASRQENQMLVGKTLYTF
jgi:hypothetical protein